MKYSNHLIVFIAIFAIMIGAMMIGFSGCSLSDEDFSDIQIIEQIIRKDQEQLFGVELANDEKPFSEDSLTLLAADKQSVFGMNIGAGIYQQSESRLLFGRVVTGITKTIRVTLINDTLASAEVIYLLSGNLKIIHPLWSQAKAFSHPITRYITFVKRTNPVTKERWTRNSISAAYGESDNSGIMIDSLRILSTQFTLSVSDPFEIQFNSDNIPELKRGQWLAVELHARSSIRPSDTLAAFVINGRNRNRTEYRQRRLLTPITPNRYGQIIFIAPTQVLGYNQILIDIYDRNVFRKIHEPYRSAMIAIPYKVIP